MKYQFTKKLKRDRTFDEVRTRIMALEKSGYEVGFSEHRFTVSTVDGAFLEIDGLIRKIDQENVEIVYSSRITYRETPKMLRYLVIFIFLALALVVSYIQAQYFFSNPLFNQDCEQLTFYSVSDLPPTIINNCTSWLSAFQPQMLGYGLVIVLWLLVFLAPPRIINRFDPYTRNQTQAEEALSELEERFGTAINS